MPSAVPLAPTQNALLARLPPASLQCLTPHLQPIELSPGESVLESHTARGYALFPLDCVISLLFHAENGDSSGVTTVGNEGMLGITLLMGGLEAPMSTLVQHPGMALQIPAEPLVAEFQRGDGTQPVLLRYLYTRMLSALQTAHCVRHHTIEQQLCVWLLESLDRQAGPHLTITQEQIAALLGVRREAVTTAAGHLQRAGWIRYRRGHIVVVDRPGLESHVCGCYGTLRRLLENLGKEFPAQRHQPGTFATRSIHAIAAGPGRDTLTSLPTQHPPLRMLRPLPLR